VNENTPADNDPSGGRRGRPVNSSVEKTYSAPVNSQNSQAPEHIFRAYDIRGNADRDLSLEFVESLGKAIATEALEQGESCLLIGHDARLHSPALRDHLIKGIITTGCHVIDTGLVPTPLLNFACFFSDRCHSGVIVTASHNPREYNGFKIILNKHSLVEADIKRLRERILEGRFAVSSAGEAGHIETQFFMDDYLEKLSKDFTARTNLHVVVDAANGAASELAPKALSALGCRVSPLFCKFDGHFPNHDPDPSAAINLQALIEKVIEEKADIGIALDGDGDRLVAITRSGKIVWPDQLLILFARDVLSRHPGCKIIFDIKSTRHLSPIIERYGGRPILWKTGHANIKAKMHETGAILAGEFSGHIFFKERWFGFDDGIYAAARLLEIMTSQGQSLDDMLSDLPSSYTTGEIRVRVSEEEKFSIVRQLIDHGDFASGEKITIDGLRVDFTEGWGLVRASNTAPDLTLRFEAENKSGIEQLKALFKRELYKIDQTLLLDF
jgi:phosphomannomutase/phosphoglucomutase